MPTILLVTDRQTTLDQVHVALATPGISVLDHSDSDTAAATAYAEGVDAVVVDMHVGSMGGMAVTRAVRAEAAHGEPGIPVTILLDRAADAFLARRAGAAHWVLKGSPASELRAAVAHVESDT